MDTTYDRIKQIVIQAGDLMRDPGRFGLGIQIKTSQKDLVTVYDKMIQDQLMEQLRQIFPAAEFVSEETASHGSLTAEDLFVIDPIDGTTNFIHNINYSAVSVAWYRFGIAVYGIVYNPFTGEVYEAIQGQGAWLNGNSICVGNDPLERSVVVFGTSPYNNDKTDLTFDIIKGIYTKCQDIRRMGSAALDLCHVADGRFGLYFEAALSFWDYAAAALILQEAGGQIMNFEGERLLLSLNKVSVLAGNSVTLAESGLIRRGKCDEQ